ncbi:hypothetical protein [Viridibacillus arvi]|uniref:hypothetical protein n=1 Tax=Viridibacillus arvi TaxID=263475 RepID=UPI003D288DBA
MKDIFSYNADIKKNAYMNWRTNRFNHIHNMHVIAAGFFSSAILLAENCLLDNYGKKADMLIFPILFNANHAIEVYLKSICWSLNELLDNGDTFKGTHDLKQLFNISKELVTKFSSDTKSLFWTENLEAYIDELYQKIERINTKGKLINDITFARYSLTMDASPQFYINEFDNVVVDLENFVEIFQEIFKNLNNIATYYLDLLERRNEMRAEIESEYRSER